MIFTMFENQEAMESRVAFPCFIADIVRELLERGCVYRAPTPLQEAEKQQNPNSKAAWCFCYQAVKPPARQDWRQLWHAGYLLLECHMSSTVAFQPAEGSGLALRQHLQKASLAFVKWCLTGGSDPCTKNIPVTE